VAGDRPVLLGLLLYLLVAVAPTLVVWVAVRLLPAVVDALAERCRRPRGPSTRPLEAAVGNLRRLRREIRLRPPSTQVRRVALLGAYDETLLEVCAVVGVDAPLAAAVGSDRPFARLLTEAALEDAGIAIDPPTGDTAAA
jgi:hypothetical protein